MFGKVVFDFACFQNKKISKASLNIFVTFNWERYYDD